MASGNFIDFELQVRTVLDIQTSDTYDIVPGCDKLYGTCTTKFANTDNFGGFNLIPANDRIFQTPF